MKEYIRIGYFTNIFMMICCLASQFILLAFGTANQADTGNKDSINMIMTIGHIYTFIIGIWFIAYQLKGLSQKKEKGYKNNGRILNIAIYIVIIISLILGFISLYFQLNVLFYVLVKISTNQSYLLDLVFQIYIIIVCFWFFIKMYFTLKKLTSL